MIITYHGKQFFKIAQGDTVFAINPLSKDSKQKIKPAKFGSDIALCTVRHPDYNGFEHTEYNDKKPFIIQGPGSYEINGHTIVGFQSKARIDNADFVNTIYFFNFEGISFCFLGDLQDEQIDQKIKEYTESVDVIFVPVGGEGTLDAVLASKVIKAFSPKIIIPMDYEAPRDTKSLQAFLKEMSQQDVKAEEKFVFKKSDLASADGKVVVLQQQ